VRNVAAKSKVMQGRRSRSERRVVGVRELGVQWKVHARERPKSDSRVGWRRKVRCVKRRELRTCLKKRRACPPHRGCRVWALIQAIAAREARWWVASEATGSTMPKAEAMCRQWTAKGKWEERKATVQMCRTRRVQAAGAVRRCE